jgi:hypothetical protein
LSIDVQLQLLVLLGAQSVHPLAAEMFETYRVLARWLELSKEEDVVDLSNVELCTLIDTHAHHAACAVSCGRC